MGNYSYDKKRFLQIQRQSLELIIPLAFCSFPLQLRPPVRRGERDGAGDVGRDALLVLQAAARAGRGRGQRRHRRRSRRLHQRLPPRHRVGREEAIDSQNHMNQFLKILKPMNM